MNHWNVISRLGLILFIGITLSSEFAHSAGQLTLHGKILKPDNTPVNSASVSFQIQIRSPGVENCLLYQETQTLNLSSNPGIFNLSIGSGTRPAATVDGGFTLNQIFQNRSLIDLSAAPGACTNPATSYTPAADDQRNISIQFNDGSGWQSVAIQKINPVPRALDSGKVGGYDSAQLLRVADGVPTAQTELSGAQWTELLAVISGTSTVYSKPNQLNGVNLPALSNGQTMVWNAGAWTAVTPQALPVGGTNGQVLTSDGAGGATWTAMGTNASSLSSGTLSDARLSSNVALKNAANSFSIGNQSITNGAATEVNLILKGAAAQSANMLEVRNSANTLLYSVETSGTPVANTDLANKAYVDSANSTSSANAVRKDGTTALTGNWAVGNFDITGIKNIGTAGYFNQAGMAAPAVSAAGEGRIYFDSVAGKFKVSQNGGAYADLVGGGGSSQWITSGSDIYYSSGNVGIGTSSPSMKLDVAGSFSADSGRFRNPTSGQSTSIKIDNAIDLGFWNIVRSGNSLTYSYNNESSKGVMTGTGTGNITFTSGNITANSLLLSAGNGLLSGGADTVVVRTAATERIRIDSVGNVGIGTATPGASLDVNGDIAARGIAAPALSAAGQGRIYFDSGANKFKVSQNGGAYADLVGGGSIGGSGTTGALPKFTAANTLGDSAISEGATDLTISKNIIVPTNTTITAQSGGAKYEIAPWGLNIHAYDLTSANGVTMLFRSLGGGWDAAAISVSKLAGSNHDGTMLLKTGNGGNQLFLDSNGNVGIGTVAPGQKLTVAGTIESTSGGVKFPDGTTQTSRGLASTDIVIASYPKSADFILNASVYGIIDWGAGDTDTHSGTTVAVGTINSATGAWSTTNWKYTIPSDGYYEIETRVTYIPTSSGTYNWNASIFKNGVVFKEIYDQGWGAGTNLAIHHPQIKGIWQFTTGDYIDIRCWNNYGNSTPCRGDYLTIKKVRN